MARFSCTETKMSLEPLSRSDEIIPRQPKRKLVPGHGFVFKNLSSDLFKKQRENGQWINKEACLVNDITGESIRREMTAIGVDDNGSKKFVRESLVFMRKTSHSARLIRALFINMFAFTSYSVAVLAALFAKTGLLLLKSLQIPKFWKWMNGRSRLIKYHMNMFLMNGFKGTKMSKMNVTTSASQINKWRLIELDILSTMDVYSIDTFLVGLGVLLVYGVLYRLFFYVLHRFLSKNDRK